MRLCLVHGFTQTGASWGPVADALRARGYDVATPDVAGHGRASAARADVNGAAELLAHEVGELGGARGPGGAGGARGPGGAGGGLGGVGDEGGAGAAAWAGYSMGGRVVLHLALSHPELVSRLVLVSTTAGIADHGDRDRRRREDEVLAAELERDGVAAFVERWLQGPLWVSLPRDRAGVEHRLANTAAGLASSLRLAGTGAQEPLWDRLGEIRAPTLVVTGALDAKFTALGKELSAAIRDAALVTLPGVGHAVPWEDPRAFVDVVDSWLRG